MGESCNDSSQCAGSNTECSVDSDECHCEAGYYVDNNGQCQEGK